MIRIRPVWIMLAGLGLIALSVLVADVPIENKIVTLGIGTLVVGIVLWVVGIDHD